MIAKKLLTTIAFAFVLLFSGCAEDDFVGVDGLCPLVVSTVPEDGDINVPLNQIITATFNEKMNPTTITETSFTISSKGVLIDGTVSYDGLTATFVPASPLQPDTKYTGTITTMAKDERGNALQENYVWSFTTAPIPEFLVVVSSNPLIGGITTGGGLFEQGTTVTVNAVPSAGYTFTNWTVNGTQVSTSANYQFVLIADRTLVANYTAIPAAQFAVNTSAFPVAGGSTTGSGSYDARTVVTVTAQANVGYTFTNWTEGGVIVPGAGANYQFVLTGNRNLVANFTVNTYTLTVIAVNGTVSKNPNQLTYNHGTTVVLTPTALPGFQFSHWNGDASGNNNPLTVIMNSNKIITANFIPIPPVQFNVVLSAVPVSGGTTDGAGRFNGGTLVQVTAIPASGYKFDNWTENGVIVAGAGANYQFVLTQDRNLVANFSLIAIAGNTCPNPIVPLGLAGNYAILAESGISTTGVTSVTGDMGVSPISASAITGFDLIMDSSGLYSTSSLVNGKIYAADYTTPTPANLTAAVNNMRTAYTFANGLPADFTELYSGNLNGQTLASGVYKYSTGLLITNQIILDGGGNDCAPFVFQIAGNLTVSPSTKIILINGAKADNIYWVVAGTGATLDTDVDFSGNILSYALISVNTRSSVKGRLLAQSAVTLIGNTIVKPSN